MKGRYASVIAPSAPAEEGATKAGRGGRHKRNTPPDTLPEHLDPLRSHRPAQRCLFEGGRRRASWRAVVGQLR
eukprot:428153-Prorocentrum_minimum.AAC.1